MACFHRRMMRRFIGNKSNEINSAKSIMIFFCFCFFFLATVSLKIHDPRYDSLCHRLTFTTITFGKMPHDVASADVVWSYGCALAGTPKKDFCVGEG